MFQRTEEVHLAKAKATDLASALLAQSGFVKKQGEAGEADVINPPGEISHMRGLEIRGVQNRTWADVTSTLPEGLCNAVLVRARSNLAAFALLKHATEENRPRTHVMNFGFRPDETGAVNECIVQTVAENIIELATAVRSKHHELYRTFGTYNPGGPEPYIILDGGRFRRLDLDAFHGKINAIAGELSIPSKDVLSHLQNVGSILHELEAAHDEHPLIEAMGKIEDLNRLRQLPENFFGDEGGMRRKVRTARFWGSVLSSIMKAVTEQKPRCLLHSPSAIAYDSESVSDGYGKAAIVLLQKIGRNLMGTLVPDYPADHGKAFQLKMQTAQSAPGNILSFMAARMLREIPQTDWYRREKDNDLSGWSDRLAP